MWETWVRSLGEEKGYPLQYYESKDEVSAKKRGGGFTGILKEIH